MNFAFKSSFSRVIKAFKKLHLQILKKQKNDSSHDTKENKQQIFSQKI
jgi:hypothetical protein